MFRGGGGLVLFHIHWFVHREKERERERERETRCRGNRKHELIPNAIGFTEREECVNDYHRDLWEETATEQLTTRRVRQTNAAQISNQMKQFKTFDDRIKSIQLTLLFDRTEREKAANQINLNKMRIAIVTRRDEADALNKGAICV
jgi:hypothetical protein